MQLPDFKLERYFARYEFEAPYLLSSSDCESFSVRELLQLHESANKQLQDLWLGYTESNGHPALREAISTLYTNTLPDQILVHAGAEEAIFNFMHVALQPGDHAIVHWPGYQSLHQIAAALGCDLTFWPAQEANGWALNLDFLESAIRKSTRAIIINCPHNPTGYLMSQAEFRHVIALARAHDIYLFSDEVYRFLEYDSSDRLPAACDLYEKAVSLGVMSKAFGLAGLRIGWIATHDTALMDRLRAFKDYTTICNSAPSELLATIALGNKEAILSRNAAIIRQNLSQLTAFFEKYHEQFDWQKPKAGCIAFPTLLSPQDSEKFCHDVVTRSGVLLLPSTMYDCGNRHFRIGFGRKNIPAALRAFEQFLNNKTT